MTADIDLNATGAAMRDAASRVATVLRQTPDPNARAGTLDWTVAETAAHLTGSIDLLTGFITGEHDAQAMLEAARNATTAAERSAAGNAEVIEGVKERDLTKLASMVVETVDRFVKTAESADPNTAHLTEVGIAMTPPVMAAVNLGELVIHGLDIARGANARWDVPRNEALLVAAGVVALIPDYVDKEATSGKHYSYELRLRGGPKYRVEFHDGTAQVSDAGGKVDCWISADPAAFLLVGYGRVGQWDPVLRGKLLSGGRKPWLGPKFGSLLTSV